MESGTFRVHLDDFVIKEMVQEVEEMFEFQCKQKKIKLFISVDPRLNCIVANSDRGRIKQVLLNLMTNSFKFTFQGHIMLNVCLVKWSGNEALEFSVSDTGIGIRLEDQDKLFKLFGLLSQNERINPSGCGIGLTVSKRFIEALNGEIHLESTEGEGTKVTFTIPLVIAPKSEIFKMMENE